MKEMVYKRKSERELLAKGEYKGVPFYVISLGTHPCAYIDIKGVIESINIDDIPCHGGITYNEPYLITSGIYQNGEKIDGRWFVGWDYSHWGDYTGWLDDDMITDPQRRHTTEEMVEDCKKAIDYVVSLSDRQMEEETL